MHVIILTFKHKLFLACIHVPNTLLEKVPMNGLCQYFTTLAKKKKKKKHAIIHTSTIKGFAYCFSI